MAEQFVQYMTYAFYVTMPTAGVMLNCYVFSKLMRIARRSGSRFETTSGLPLSAMSVSDSICLLATLSQFLFHLTARNMKDSSMHELQNNTTSSTTHLSFICKVDLYLMHSTSAFSVWCWLVLSILRYIAVFHPLKYRTIWRQPRHALKVLAVVCAASEVWILRFVIYDSEGNSCVEDPAVGFGKVKIAHMLDIVLFYAIPSGLRLIFDSIVLFRCYSCNGLGDSPPIYDRRLAISAASMERKTQSFELRSLPTSFSKSANSSFELESCGDGTNRAQLVLVASITAIQRKGSTTVVGYHCTAHHLGRATKSKSQALSKRRTAMILRSLVISAINLMCNLPSHILRAYFTIQDGGPSEETEEERNVAEIMIEQISQVLYFSQFVCNVFYLSTSIYETSALPPARTAPPLATIGRQISRCESRDADTEPPNAVKRQTSQPLYLQPHPPMLGDMKRQSSTPEYLEDNHVMRHPVIRRQASHDF